MTDLLSPFDRPALAVLAAGPADAAPAHELAQRLGLPQLPAGAEPASCTSCAVLLVVAGPALYLQQTRQFAAAAATGRRDKPGRRPGAGALPGPVTVDFGSEGMRYRRRSGHNELLGKAVGRSGKRQLGVLDTTAGLGRDGFVLADMGCRVTLCEREPVIAALLEHGLRAAAGSADEWLVQVAQRLRLHCGDARTLPADSADPFDVIYLDPMFPQRDKSAAVKKEMALFHSLVGGGAEQDDADQLLLWALQQDVARVVVKRPSRAPWLADQKPSHQLAGKAVRFDVYVRRGFG